MTGAVTVFLVEPYPTTAVARDLDLDLLGAAIYVVEKARADTLALADCLAAAMETVGGFVEPQLALAAQARFRAHAHHYDGGWSRLRRKLNPRDLLDPSTRDN